MSRIQEYEESLISKGIMNNCIFHYIQSDADIPGLVEVFLRHTKGVEFGIDLQEAEKAYTLATIYYLFWEAPADEMNGYMLMEIAMCTSLTENSTISDADRLFEMLREKTINHTALVYYDEFKKSSLYQNSIVESVLLRLSDFNIGDNLLAHIYRMGGLCKEGISHFTITFLSNTHSVLPDELKESERHLLSALIYYLYFDNESAALKSLISPDDNKVTYLLRLLSDDYLDNRFKALVSNEPNHPAAKCYTAFKKTSLGSESRIMQSLITRMEFWRTFG
jgi:hypothetical protein